MRLRKIRLDGLGSVQQRHTERGVNSVKNDKLIYIIAGSKKLKFNQTNFSLV